jgi:hypothetical protein
MHSQVMRIHLAPGQPFALAENRHGEPHIIMFNGPETDQTVAIPNALAASDFVEFSPSGHSAVLYSMAAGRLQLITGLPVAPRIVRDLDAGILPEPPKALAVSDDGGSIVVAITGGVYWLSAEGPAQFVLSVTDVASLAFIPNSGNALVADRRAGSVFLLRNDGSVTTRMLATGLDGIDQVCATTDGQKLFLTNPAANRIWSVTVLGGAVRSFDLAVSPSRIDRLSGTDTFLISSAPGQPAWIFFRQGDDAGAVFVPAVKHNLRRVMGTDK